MSRQHSVQRRDSGLTLPELLVTVSVLGLIMTVLAASIVVTIRQTDNTEGRLNVARAEQSIDLYLPNDLASAETVDTDPDARPCGSSCPSNVVFGGSNALMLSWTTIQPDAAGTGVVTVTTNVSYHFNETSTPGIYELRRIECVSVGGGAWTCETVRVLGNIELLTNWEEGDPVPIGVIQVSRPLAADADSEEDVLADGVDSKNARRVVVTVNGGGDGGASGGGSNRISITAGGTSRTTIPADSISNAPTFVEARSRCGGPIALIVDDSGSIGGSMGAVEDGVELFVETFAGTPTQIQVVRFDTTSGVVGGGGAWTRYFDMTNDTDVTDLLAAIRPGLNADGGTNWEDAWFRAFYQQSGTDILQKTPELVVFFTDGEPTYERLRHRASGGGDIPGQPLPGPGWPTYNGGYYSNGQDYSQVAFNRTNWIADRVRGGDVTIIGVGVGPAFDDESLWIESPGRGYHWVYERGYRQFQRLNYIYEQQLYQSRQDFERADEYQTNRAFQTKVDFERRVGGNWQNATLAQYLSANANSRQIGSQTNRTWETVTPSQYWQYSAGVLGDAAFWRENGTGGWSDIPEAFYDVRNTTPDQSDGWRVNGWGTDISPTDYYTNSPLAPEKFRINGNRNQYYSVTRTEWLNYSAASPGNWRTNGWATITSEFYAANNVGSNHADESDGFRRRDGSWVWITQAEYAANNVTGANPPSSDGYRDQGKQYVNDDDDAMDWEPSGNTNTGGGYRRRAEFSPPYDFYEEADEEQRSNELILGELVAGSEADILRWDGAVPGNAKDANLFVLPNFSQFAQALQSVALAECGGTLTLSTKVGATRAADPFSYENSRVTNPAGVNLTVQPTRVTTSSTFPTGTFDFSIPPGSAYVTVDIMPQNLSELGGYTPAGWTCKAGITPINDLEFPPVEDVAEYPGWTGVRVRVAANQAVACTLNVTRS